MMPGRVVNRHLHQVVMQIAQEEGVSYAEAVKILANRSGYRDHTKIYAYIRGALTPGFAGARRIAKASGKTVDYLFGG